MPLLGLGTTHSGGYDHDAVVYALKECNYRMIDTAKRYGVESHLSLAIKVRFPTVSDERYVFIFIILRNLILTEMNYF